MSSSSPLVVVLSGPSGVGKDSALACLRERGHPFHFAVTATTRPPRSGEVEGVNYHFVSRERFQEMVENGELLEHACVYGHRYGVPKEEVRWGLAQGLDVILRLDVQGAATVKKLLPEAVLIFMAPASEEELGQRLRKRLTEGPACLQERLAKFREEMKRLAEFDYLVVNHEGKLGEAVDQIAAIITAEKCRTRPRRIELR